MPKKKRHSHSEIVGKIAQADELAAQGKLQSEIARALGVSVMTLHRWRKASLSQPQPTPTQFPPPAVTDQDSRPELPRSSEELAERITDLQSENTRLRRLVTDLLLEKMRLEEMSGNDNHNASGILRRRP